MLKDGLRFLFIILFTTAVYNPIRSFLVAALAVALGFGGLAGLSLAAGAPSALTTLILFAGALGTLLLVGAGVAVHQLNFLLLGPIRRDNPLERALQRLLGYKGLLLTGLVVLAGSGLGLAAAVLLEGVDFALVAGLLGLLFLGLMLLVGGILMRVIWVVGQRQAALTSGTMGGFNRDPR